MSFYLRAISPAVAIGRKAVPCWLFLFITSTLQSQTCTPSVSLSTSAVNGSICIGQSATYTVSGCVGYTFSNIPSTSPPMTSSSGVVSPTTNTSYQVTGINQAGCISSTQVVIFVNQLPVVSAVASPTMVCMGFPSTLVATAAPSGTAHAYMWGHGDTMAKSVVNPLFTSVYTVTATNTITSCDNTKTISVAVFNPTFQSTADTAICRGDTISLFASGAASFTWTGGPDPGTGTVYVVSPTVVTVYTVGATSWTVNGAIKCNSMKMISVGIFLQPTITAVATPSFICLHGTAILTAFGGQTYYWPSLNVYGETVAVTPSIYTSSSIVIPYQIFGTDLYGCKDTFELGLIVGNCHPPPPNPIGIGEWQPDRFNLFPNPADRFFDLDVPGNMIVRLYDEMARCVKEVQFISPGQYRVHTDDLSPGVYILTGWQESQLFRKKIVVQH